MENFSQNQIPFKENFVKSDVTDKYGEIEILHELENNPNKIIRMLSLRDLSYEHYDQKNPKELVAIGKKLYQELEKYDIQAPVEFVIGKNKTGEQVVCGITDRITNELKENEITPPLARQTKKLYTSLSQYYLDKSNKLSNGEMFLTDIRGFSQYVFGKKIDDTEPRIYLVDTDLYMHNDKVSFYYVIAWLIRHMSGVEKALGDRFDSARKNIKQILANPELVGLTEEQKETISKTITEANNFLRGEFSKESDDLPSGNFRID